MKQYKLINNVMGWVAFLISAVTYILTTEASASFWDCGEFISTADKLLVGHPPGAPFFMIVARFFAILAPDVTLVAKAVNIMSALASAFTILFLFWTITHLARKMMIDGTELQANGEPETWRTWAVMGAGMVGALAYTFSDTFWFSAVEGEVYGMSSLFTAAVFWCILKWENVADEPHSSRWLVLIAYLMGLSIGVHLLNLLCIPAMGLVYYFRKFDVTPKGVIIALGVSCVTLAVILWGIIPGLVKIAGPFDLLFVNTFGLPLNSGAIFWMLLLIAGLIFGIVYTFRHGRAIANTVLTCVSVIILGYMSFAMVVIRSAADPTMDQNSPDNVFSLIDYLNREQYGDCPLLHGQTFASPLDKSEQGDAVYVIAEKDGHKYYKEAEHKTKYKYQATVTFPRMYSAQAAHVEQYKAWSGFNGSNGRSVVVSDRETGEKRTIMIPTMMQNLRYFFSYQINFMYIRYFMWNFVGRQNDIQSHGELTHGNWITGISAIDNALYGDQDLLPDSLKNNKGHNVYFMLPLLLGLAGLFYQAGKNKKDFWVVMLLFFMTGLAIVLYLNQTPLQPRERDYAYAGSFYAFAIWIGLGVLQLIEWLSDLKCPRLVATIAASVASLIFVPGIMAEQNWDDHDRSGCTIARDVAYNYLNSCDEDAVIFTNGDNDTFPLWYAQEVEGCRTDVRVCNLSYLQTEWYCDQMKRKAYESSPCPISFTHDEYTHDRDVVYMVESSKWKDGLNLYSALNFVRSSDERTKHLNNSPERINFVPARKFFLPVDSAAVPEGAIAPINAGKIVKQININPGGSYWLKNQLMVYDMLASGNWKRPLYYAVTVGRENYFGLDCYFQLEGLAQRIVPVYGKTDRNGVSGTVNTDKMYDNVMNKFRWGSFNQPGLYLDENKSRMGSNMRMHLTRLATSLLNEAKTSPDSAEKRAKAIKVLDKIQEEIPSWAVAHNFLSLQMAEDYILAGEQAKGEEILRAYSQENWQELNYYLNLKPELIVTCYTGIQRCMAIYYEILRVSDRNGCSELVSELEAQYQDQEVFASKLLGLGE